MSTQPLDDTDEFVPRHFFWAHAMGNHEPRTVLQAVYGSLKFKEKPEGVVLLPHQERMLLNLQKGGRAPGWVKIKEKSRKGLSEPRKTPLLCNTPRTTPETAKYLPDRQHSTNVILQSDNLNVKGES